MSGSEQRGHAGRHHGIGTRDCPYDLHHHHDQRCGPPGTDPLADRRQRAREAFHDASSLGDNGWHAAEAAIETATRVKITDDIIAAAQRVVTVAGLRRDQAILALTAAFRAAGFEIEE